MNPSLNHPTKLHTPPNAQLSTLKFYHKRSLSKSSWKDEEMYESDPKKKVLTEKEDCIDDTTNAYSRSWKDKASDVQQGKQDTYARKPTNIDCFKALLPQFLTTKLAPKHELLISCHRLIDQYLSRIPTLDKKDYYRNVITHIRKSIAQISLKQLFQIVFVCPAFYTVNKDANADIIIGLPINNVQLRTQTLRKALIQYLKNHHQNGDQTVTAEIPSPKPQCKELKDFKSMACKQKTCKQKTQKNKSKLKESFVKTIVDCIKEKEIKNEAIKMEQEKMDEMSASISVSMSMSVIKSIEEIFIERKVRNIFKVNLIEMLHKKCPQIKPCQMINIVQKIQTSGKFITLINTKNGQVQQIDENHIQPVKNAILNK